MSTVPETLAWYAVRTFSRAEKSVAARLGGAGIESYVPLVVQKRKWSDRIKVIESPLITCYVFVRTSADRMTDVLRTQGVVGFVKEEKVPVVIPAAQMENFMRSVLRVPCDVDFTVERIKKGSPVMVTRGPLMGMKGELAEYAHGHKMVIRLQSIGCALVTIDENSIERL